MNGGKENHHKNTVKTQKTVGGNRAESKGIKTSKYKSALVAKTEKQSTQNLSMTEERFYLST